MTLDVTIGRKLKDDVVQCPDSDKDICNPNLTNHPREAYRSGSSDFWSFWRRRGLADIYLSMRKNPNSNDIDIALLKPFIKRINALKEPLSIIDKDRLKWLKYWSNKATELCGEEAAIMFS